MTDGGWRTRDDGGHLLANLLLFGRLLHGLGLDVNPGRMLDLVQALDYVEIGRRSDFYYAARSLLVHRREDLAKFDEAFNLWWRPRDTGYHDHTGSCVGVHVISGRAWNEALTVAARPVPREYGPGETFWFPGDGIHRMDHEAGAVTIHVYSPPILAIGHYDITDGQLRRTPGLPDEPSPPSAALYEALHPPVGAG